MYLSTCNNKNYSSPRIWINFPIKNDLFVYLIIKIINGLGIFLSTSYLLSFTYIMYSNKVFLNILQMSNLLCFQLLRKKLYWIIHHYDFMYARNEFKFTNWRNFHFNWICTAPWLFFFIYIFVTKGLLGIIISYIRLNTSFRDLDCLWGIIVLYHFSQ